MSKAEIIHFGRWYNTKINLLCGAKDGIINPRGEDIITCKNCKRIMAARGWIDKNLPKSVQFIMEANHDR